MSTNAQNVSVALGDPSLTFNGGWTDIEFGQLGLPCTGREQTQHGAGPSVTLTFQGTSAAAALYTDVYGDIAMAYFDGTFFGNFSTFSDQGWFTCNGNDIWILSPQAEQGTHNLTIVNGGPPPDLPTAGIGFDGLHMMAFSYLTTAVSTSSSTGSDNPTTTAAATDSPTDSLGQATSTGLPTPTAASAHFHKNSGAIAAGVTIGILALLGAIALVYFLRRRKPSRHPVDLGGGLHYTRYRSEEEDESKSSPNTPGIAVINPIPMNQIAPRTTRTPTPTVRSRTTPTPTQGADAPTVQRRAVQRKPVPVPVPSPAPSDPAPLTDDTRLRVVQSLVDQNVPHQEISNVLRRMTDTHGGGPSGQVQGDPPDYDFKGPRA